MTEIFANITFICVSQLRHRTSDYAVCITIGAAAVRYIENPSISATHIQYGKDMQTNELRLHKLNRKHFKKKQDLGKL
jgi:hypothetical protein